MADGYVPITQSSIKTPQGVVELNRMLQLLFDVVAGDGETVKVYNGYGSPEGVIVAGIGSIYMRKDGGSGTSVYAKESGTGASGWSAL